MHLYACVTLLLAGTLSAAKGQQLPGTNDPSFNTADVILNANGFDGAVNSMAQQSDGKLIVAGSFDAYTIIPRDRIIRLNADRSSDDSFDPGTGFDGLVLDLALQTDGKIIVGGNFTTYNGTSRNHLARLNADGSLDQSFTSGTEFNGPVRTIALQPDGKLLVGGNFTTYNGTSRNNVARLNPDGSLDDSFNPGTGFTGFPNNAVLSIVLSDNGKIVIGGSFTTYNGTSRNNITRLNADGTLDTSFNPGSGFNSMVNDIALQSDGKIVVVGTYGSYNGAPHNKIVRLNTDGSFDASFVSGTGFNGTVKSIALQNDGKMVVGGTFNNYNRMFRSGISVLNPDGSLDTSFSPGNGFYYSIVNAIIVQQDGMVAVGGNFTSYNGIPRNRFAALNADGSLEEAFSAGTGFNRNVTTIALQTDGKAVVGGWFTSFNGTSRNYIARLNTDGSLDTSFDPGAGFNDSVSSVAVQSDGKLVVGGYFTSYNGTARNKITRLNPDGSLDNSFVPGTGFEFGTVRSIALQSDGKIVVGGGSNSYNGTITNRILRLNPDGSLDASFTTGTEFGDYSRVWDIAVQKDGKLVVGGWFSTYNGIARNSIVRLHADGSLDESFDPGTSVNGGVNTIALQSDGKLVVGGYFATYSGAARNKIARLHADGTLDASFDPGTGFNGSVRALSLQRDGKAVVGGYFEYYNGTPRNSIARLNTDGTLDTSFNPGAGFTETYVAVWAVAIQSDGNVVVGGNFTSFEDIVRNRIARLYAGEGTALSTGTDQQPGLNVLVYPNPSQGDFLVEVSGAEVVGAVNLVLYNALGRQVLSRDVTATEAQSGVQLSASGLAGGVYMLRISTRGRTITKRLVLTE